MAYSASIYLSKGSLKKVFWFVGITAFINAVLFLLIFPAELRASVEGTLGNTADFILNHGVRKVPDITETALFELQSFGANLVMLSRQPVLYVLISVAGAFTAFFGGRLLEKFYFLRRQNKIDFTMWQVPDMFIWVFLGSVIIVLATMLPEMILKLQNLSENPVVLTVRNWFIAFVGIGFLIYSVQGISVLVRLLARLHIAMPLLSIGLVLFFIVMWFLGPPAYDVVIVLLSLFFAFGLFDLFFDFRKIHHRRQTDDSNQA